MRISFHDRLTRKEISEGSAFTVTVKFWDDSAEDWVASTPTSIRYRIDGANDTQILGWTSVSAASSVNITLTAANNAIVDNNQDSEGKVLTVERDNGLSTQYRGTYRYDVRNLVGIT
jgi:hypothetical protein